MCQAHLISTKRNKNSKHYYLLTSRLSTQLWCTECDPTSTPFAVLSANNQLLPFITHLTSSTAHQTQTPHPMRMPNTQENSHLQDNIDSYARNIQPILCVHLIESVYIKPEYSCRMISNLYSFARNIQPISFFLFCVLFYSSQFT